MPRFLIIIALIPYTFLFTLTSEFLYFRAVPLTAAQYLVSSIDIQQKIPKISQKAYIFSSDTENCHINPSPWNNPKVFD